MSPRWSTPPCPCKCCERRRAMGRANAKRYTRRNELQGKCLSCPRDAATGRKHCDGCLHKMKVRKALA